MDYYLAKRKDQQVDMCLRRRLIESAAGTQSWTWLGRMAGAQRVKVTSWKKINALREAKNQEVDVRYRAYMKRLSGGWR